MSLLTPRNSSVTALQPRAPTETHFDIYFIGDRSCAIHGKHKNMSRASSANKPYLCSLCCTNFIPNDINYLLQTKAWEAMVIMEHSFEIKRETSTIQRSGISKIRCQ